MTLQEQSSSSSSSSSSSTKRFNNNTTQYTSLIPSLNTLTEELLEIIFQYCSLFTDLIELSQTSTFFCHIIFKSRLWKVQPIDICIVSSCFGCGRIKISSKLAWRICSLASIQFGRFHLKYQQLEKCLDALAIGNSIQKLHLRIDSLTHQVSRNSRNHNKNLMKKLRSTTGGGGGRGAERGLTPLKGNFRFLKAKSRAEALGNTITNTSSTSLVQSTSTNNLLGDTHSESATSCSSTSASSSSSSSRKDTNNSSLVPTPPNSSSTTTTTAATLNNNFFPHLESLTIFSWPSEIPSSKLFQFIGNHLITLKLMESFPFDLFQSIKDYCPILTTLVVEGTPPISFEPFTEIDYPTLKTLCIYNTNFRLTKPLKLSALQRFEYSNKGEYMPNNFQEIQLTIANLPSLTLKELNITINSHFINELLQEIASQHFMKLESLNVELIERDDDLSPNISYQTMLEFSKQCSLLQSLEISGGLVGFDPNAFLLLKNFKYLHKVMLLYEDAIIDVLPTFLNDHLEICEIIFYSNAEDLDDGDQQDQEDNNNNNNTHHTHHQNHHHLHHHFENESSSSSSGNNNNHHHNDVNNHHGLVKWQMMEERLEKISEMFPGVKITLQDSWWT